MLCCCCMAPSDQQSAWMYAASAELDLLGESHATEMTDEQVVQKLPEELRRQSLSGTLPVSLNTLRVSLWKQQLPLEFCIVGVLPCSQIDWWCSKQQCKK